MFGAVKITKNVDRDKYSYSGYGLWFDSRSLFLISNFDCGKNAMIFGVYVSLSVHTNNKTKDILVLGKRLTQELDNIATAEAEYSINFSRSQRTFCQVFIIMESTVFYLLIPQKYINSK